METARTLILEQELPDSLKKKAAKPGYRRVSTLGTGSLEDAPALPQPATPHLSFLDLAAHDYEAFLDAQRTFLEIDLGVLGLGPDTTSIDFEEYLLQLQARERVREELDRLRRSDAKVTAEIARDLVAALEDAAGPGQDLVGAELGSLPSLALTSLMDCLADIEFAIFSPRLRAALTGALSSPDREVAQSAALTLIFCAEDGRSLLQERLDYDSGAPHRELLSSLLEITSRDEV